jgi:hypothetical protein
VFARALGLESTFALAVVGLGSSPPARLSYRHVEQRFQSRVPSGPSPVRVALASVVVTGVAVSAAGAAVAFAMTPMGRVTSAIEASAVHIDRTCQQVPLTPELRGCVYGGGAHQIALVGDSNAGHFSEGVLDAVDQERSTLTIVTTAARPMIDLEVRNHGVVDRSCRAATDAVSAWLDESPPDILILASASDIHIGIESRELQRGTVTGEAAYVAALEQRVRRAQAAGSAVVTIHPIPKFDLLGGSAGPAPCAALRLQVAPDSCAKEMPRAVALDRQAVGLRAEQVVARATGITTISPFDALCPPDPCSDLAGGTWLYRDARHISASASSGLSDLIRSALAATEDGPGD